MNAKTIMSLVLPKVAAVGATALLLAFSAGCGGEEGIPGETGDRPPSAVEQPIENGMTETGYPAVGELGIPGGFCTAELLSSSVAISARHCLGSVMHFNTGTSSANFVSYPIDGYLGHPGNVDYMLLHLPTPVTGVTPLVDQSGRTSGAWRNVHDRGVRRSP